MYTFNLHMAGSDSWMSVKEAATYLGKSAHWLYQNREPFHNMALMCPDTTVADVDAHTKAFRTMCAELVQ